MGICIFLYPGISFGIIQVEVLLSVKITFRDNFYSYSNVGIEVLAELGKKKDTIPNIGHQELFKGPISSQRIVC